MVFTGKQTVFILVQNSIHLSQPTGKLKILLVKSGATCNKKALEFEAM